MMQTHKLSQADKIEVHRLRSEGKKLHEIAQRFGVTRQCIHYVLKRSNKKGKTYARLRIEARHNKVIRLAQSGMGLTPIAKIVGLNRRYVDRILRDRGVKWLKYAR